MPSESSRPALLSPPSLITAKRPPAFSAELHGLIVRFKDRPAHLGEVLVATEGRGYDLLLVLIALPFISPIPLPGLSIPFGLAVTLLGTQLALVRKPWLPQRLLQRELPAQTLAKWLGAASRITKWLEYFLRPRLGFVHSYVIFSQVTGCLIALSGLMLMLPLPLPFSNSLPAWTVLLLAAGALGRDGLFFFAGCASFALSVAYFTLVAFGGMEAVDKVWRLLGEG
jgi:hypothetical protein